MGRKWVRARAPVARLHFCVAVGVSSFVACTAEVPRSPPTQPAWCLDAASRLGHVACDEDVTLEEWRELSVATPWLDRLREAKFLVPLTPEAPLPFLVAHTTRYPRHGDLLSMAFPELHPSPATALGGSDRAYLAGTLVEWLTEDGQFLFGFHLTPNASDPKPTQAEVEQVYMALLAGTELRPVRFAPLDPKDVDLAGPRVPTFVAPDVDYETYARGVTAGTLRYYALHKLREAETRGSIGWQDVLLLDDVPADLVSAPGAVVTGARQDHLSHLSLRTRNRGAPSCYVRHAGRRFAHLQGELVRVTCLDAFVEVVPVSRDEAENIWTSTQHLPVEFPDPYLGPASMPDLLDMPTTTSSDRQLAPARWGAKAAQLATAYQRISPEVRLPGLAVPFQEYQRFLEEQTWSWDGGPPVSFAETLHAWHREAEFLVDGELRHARLGALASAMRSASVDSGTISRLAQRIAEVHGSTRVMVRLRSSSNAEDGLRFSGAGLYQSVSACAADDLDGDTSGPSLCDPTEDDERTLAAGLPKVWASLWSTHAWDERAWFGVDHERVAMGVLVTPRIRGELANIVVLTADPVVDAGDHMLVSAQAGEYSPVAPPPGVLSEVVELSRDGQIRRIQASSLVPAGATVLSDAQLAALAGGMVDLEATFPIDRDGPFGAPVWLDAEWKVLADGRLVLKQVRPWVR